MRLAAVSILSAAASGSTENGDALSLLQTSSVKVLGSNLQSNKECKAAKTAFRDAKTKVKTDKAAIKAARAALKEARAARVESEKEKQTAAEAVTGACPDEQVDFETPDEGCSSTIVTSIRGNGPDDLLDGVQCNYKYSTWFTNTIKDGQCLPGGGAKGGDGQPYGDKLGISVMQPCSAAWTGGGFIYPTGVNLQTGMRGNVKFSEEKKGMPNPCSCLEWAKSVAPWPQSYATTYYKIGGICRVFMKNDLPWKEGGPALYLETSRTQENHNNAFTCFMGNPDAWKAEVEAEKAANQLLDKCSKPNWGHWFVQQTDVNVVPKGEPKFKPLYTGSGPNGAVINTKECFKVARAEPACKDAVALSWQPQSGGQCKCLFGGASQESHTRGSDHESIPQSCLF